MTERDDYGYALKMLAQAGFSSEEAEAHIEATTERFVELGDDREEAAQYAAQLLGIIGLSPEEVLLTLIDDDLWLLPPEARFAYRHDTMAENISIWEEAAGKLQALSDIALNKDIFANEVMSMCLEDAAERAREAGRRARQRLEEGGEDSNG